MVVAHVVVSSVALIGFAALAVDIGMLYSVRSDLQNAADAAALAGVSGYFSNAAIVKDADGVETLVRQRTGEYASANESFRAGGTQLDLSDITVGWFNFANRSAPLDTSGANPFNAVRAIARRSAESDNGAVLFYFSRIFGMDEGSVSATAIAAMDDRFSGFEHGSGPALLPFTIHIDIYNDMLVNGEDEYAFADGDVDADGDGVPEVKLFPYKLSGSGSDAGAGNFGILEFGGSGASQVSDNIESGISAEDLAAEMGTSSPEYYNEDGDAQSYWITGEPGMKASLESAVEERIGDIIAHFVHDDVTGNGANTQYNNIGIRAGRIMHIDLNGSPKNKALLIQPVAYYGKNIKVSANAPSTGGLLGRISLVR